MWRSRGAMPNTAGIQSHYHDFCSPLNFIFYSRGRDSSPKSKTKSKNPPFLLKTKKPPEKNSGELLRSLPVSRLVCPQHFTFNKLKQLQDTDLLPICKRKTEKSDPFPRYEKAPREKPWRASKKHCESHDQHT